MGWQCYVCENDAKYLIVYGDGRIRKDGQFMVQKRAYCEKHKPILAPVPKLFRQNFEV